MKLAYVQSDKTGQVNQLLTTAAQTLIARGLRVVGTIQIDTPRENSHHCDMDVQVLPDGDIFRISQDLGTGARGCRLDADALERAVAQTLPRLEGADLLLVNKFGKHEADGRGFRDLIAQALLQDIPVIVGTNALNLDAFLRFSDGLATRLDPDADTLQNWLATNQAIPA